MTTVEDTAEGSGVRTQSSHFRIEKRGIDHVPAAERRGQVAHLAGLWAGSCSTCRRWSTVRFWSPSG